jgi:hypothetical protein
MDAEIMGFLGKILGEMYRIQKRLEMPGPADHVIVGLLYGIEPVIREQFSFVPSDQCQAVLEALDRYAGDPEALTGYYDIMSELEAAGVNRARAKIIITYLNLMGAYTDVIRRLDSDNSPVDLRRFDLQDNEI